MTNEENQLITNYCDQLTSTGKELSVTWNGGGDEGLVEIILDDDIIERDASIESLIEECVLEYLGYGGVGRLYKSFVVRVSTKDRKIVVLTNELFSSKTRA